MPRMTVIERLILNLQQLMPPNRKGYMPREKAYESLKKLTGQDFGYDVEKWVEWINRNRKQFQYIARRFYENDDKGKA